MAMLVESTNTEEVTSAISLFGAKLNKIKHIGMDTSLVYALICSNLMPRASQIIDKFHVMKYVYEAVSGGRNLH